MRKRIGFIKVVLLFSLLLLENVCFAQGIEIESGASMLITGASSIEITDGSFINNGTYTKAAETVTFSGTTAGSISGSSNTDFNDLVIGNSTGITLKSKISCADFTVSENGNFILESSSDSTGSIIISETASGSGIVSVQRFVPDGLTGSDDWHIISSPLKNISQATFANEQGINSNLISTNPELYDYDLAPYNEGGGFWDPYLLSTDNKSFIAGKGYALRRDLSSDGMITFSNTADNLTVGDKSKLIAITKNRNGWNALGNPYTSSIAIETFLDVNDAILDASYNATYLWNPVNSQFVGFTSGSIPIGQGFIVRSSAGGGDIDFTLAMQQHKIDNFKSAEVNPQINLFAQSNNYRDQTLVKFGNNFSTGIDKRQDIGKFKGNPNISLYSQMPGNPTYDLQNQALPALGMETVRIPIGFDFAPGGNVTFTVEKENFTSEYNVYIEDTKSGTIELLNESNSNYVTNVEANTVGTGRFYLVISDQTQTDVALLKNNLFSAYSNRKRIFINGPVNSNTRFEIFSIDGKCWFTGKPQANQLDCTGFASGVYLLRILHQGTVETKKLVLAEN